MFHLLLPQVLQFSQGADRVENVRTLQPDRVYGILSVFNDRRSQIVHVQNAIDRLALDQDDGIFGDESIREQRRLREIEGNLASMIFEVVFPLFDLDTSRFNNCDSRFRGPMTKENPLCTHLNNHAEQKPTSAAAQ